MKAFGEHTEMEQRVGLLGTLWVWTFNLFSWLVDEASLREISLVMAILVSFATLLWYAGNMIIKHKEFLKALREIFRKKR